MGSWTRRRFCRVSSLAALALATRCEVEPSASGIGLLLVDLTVPKSWSEMPDEGQLQGVYALIEHANRAGWTKTAINSYGTQPPSAIVRLLHREGEARSFVKRYLRNSAFTNRDIMPFLNSQGVSSLVVVGFRADACVYETVADASHSYDVWTAYDLLFPSSVLDVEDMRAFYQRNTHLCSSAEELIERIRV